MMNEGMRMMSHCISVTAKTDSSRVHRQSIRLSEGSRSPLH